MKINELDMNHNLIIDKLSDSSKVFKVMLKSIKAEQYLWKPSPDKWSLLGIVNHLIDEEKWDFKQRIEVALENPGKDWIKIEPREWAKEERYSKGYFNAAIDEFIQIREDNVKWLKSFNNPDWLANDNYPYSIKLSAEDSLANWLAHDYLHIRQVNKMCWLYLAQLAPNTNFNYAGEW